MTSAASAKKKPAPIVWDLSHVLPATKGPAFDGILADLEARVKKLEDERPKLDAITSSADIERLVNDYTRVVEIAHRLDSWGGLSFSTDSTDENVKAFMARMDDLTTAVGNRVRFIDLWWKGLPDERAEGLMPADPDMRYHLSRARAFREHTRTESEEQIMALKGVTGSVAVDRVREIVTSEFRFKDPKSGESVTLSELARHVHDPDAGVREGTYNELWRVYGQHESLLAYLYQAVVTDWRNEKMTIRKYPSPVSVRNKWDDIPDEAIATLLDVCHANRGVFHRYFTWKGDRLGLEQMSRFHIYAPLDAAPVEVPYERSKDLVLEVFDAFSPKVGDAARRVFNENHVHVYPSAAKRGGAYCATVNSTMTPYVFLNHTNDASSLKTLAHEMGHAIHSILAEDRHPLVAHSALPMAETASVFSEMLMHKRLMADATPEQRTAILSEKLGEIYATVMRQAYFVRFEIAAHDKLANGATTADLHKFYLKELREQLGPVHVPDEFKREWTYIPHIYASPFYCYAYSFGMLLSLALFGRYQKEGDAFVPDYTQLLASGGSASPGTLLERIGVDIADRAFWQQGFDVITEMERELEKNSG